jgi:hypothetical protein
MIDKSCAAPTGLRLARVVARDYDGSDALPALRRADACHHGAIEAERSSGVLAE